MATLLYAVVVEVVKAQHLPFGGFAPAGADVLRYVLYALGFAQVLVIQGIRGRLRKGRGAEAPAPPLGTLRTTAIVTAALAEVPAVFGLVLFLIGGRDADFYLLFGWSLLLQAVYFPRPALWEGSVRATLSGDPGP